ncbi:hypothetical protein D3C85_380370 [compost metagenome]
MRARCGPAPSSTGRSPITCITAATSATLRAIGPATSKPRKIGGSPSPRGTRAREGLKPTRLVCEAGRRMEPPPSVPSAMGQPPAATSATAPPDEPPGVSAGSHGLPVGPNTGLSV